MTRPDASEIAGTLRATSGFTVPVTTSSGAADCADAVATGNCSGCSTENMLTSKAVTTFAAGGASAVVFACTLPQPPRDSTDGMAAKRRPPVKALRFIRTSGAGPSPPPPTHLELHHYACTERRLAFAKIREPHAARTPAGRIRRRQDIRPGRGACRADKAPRRTVVAARRREPAPPRPVRDVRVAISGFSPPRDVLFGHVLKIGGRVPHVGLVARICREVRRTRDGIRAIDGRQKGEIAARVVHHAAAERKGVFVLPPPRPVINHPAQERLLGSATAPVARDSAAIFAAQVPRKGEGHLVDACAIGLVVVPDLDAVIGVDARAARVTQCIRAVAVVVEHQGKPFVRTIQNLSSQAAVAVELVVRLPAVDYPGFDLQLVSGEPLNSQSIEEPQRVRGHERRLVSLVVE